jgi:hypothetical protein
MLDAYGYISNIYLHNLKSILRETDAGNVKKYRASELAKVIPLLLLNRME